MAFRPPRKSEGLGGPFFELPKVEAAGENFRSGLEFIE